MYYKKNIVISRTLVNICERINEKILLVRQFLQRTNEKRQHDTCC